MHRTEMYQGFHAATRVLATAVIQRRPPPATRSGLPSSPSVAQRIDQHGEGGRGLAAAWVIEMVAREGWAPIGEHPDEPSRVEMRLHLVLGQVGHAEPVQRRV